MIWADKGHGALGDEMNIVKLTNAFSLNMVSAFPVEVHVGEISVATAREALVDGFESVVGHADTAAVFSDVLGIEVPAVRSTISLQKGETMIIGQYRGPRLPEGAHVLPEGATIQWLRLKVL